MVTTGGRVNGAIKLNVMTSFSHSDLRIHSVAATPYKCAQTVRKKALVYINIEILNKTNCQC